MREKQSDLFELWEAEAQQEKFKQKLLQAEAGDAQAQMFVARGYFYGEGTKRDCAAAIPWLKKAAERDDSLAWFLLGCCYTDVWGWSQMKQKILPVSNELLISEIITPWE